MAPTCARARAEGPLFVEFPGFSPRPEPSGGVKECSHTVYWLHTKKPLPWRVTGARVVRHVERPRVRSKNAYIAEPAPELQPMCCEIGAPRREIGVELDECSHIVYRLHTKKPPPWRVTGPALRVTSSAHGCGRRTYTSRSPPELQPMCCEIGAPRREIGVELDVYPRDPP